MTVELPTQRVFRPQSDKINQLINKLMEIHVVEGHIARASWTEYVQYLLNKDLLEVRQRARQKVGG